MSDFYELKDSNTSPPPMSSIQSPPRPQQPFKIPSSTSLISQEEDVQRPMMAVKQPPPPPSTQPPPVRFSYQKLGPPSPSYSQQMSEENSLLANPRNIHCVVIADHIMDCPICSRFYRNYTPIYNLIILILGIALIVLIIKCNNRNVPTTYIRTSSTPPPPTI